MKSNKVLNIILISLIVVVVAVGGAMIIRSLTGGSDDDAVYGENLVLNGGFELYDEHGLPANWGEDMWLWDEGLTILKGSAESHAGDRSISILSHEANDARFSQEVDIVPGATYKISGWVRAEGCGTDAAGAGISISDTFSSTEYLYDTGGEWQELTMYGIAGSGQNSMTVMCRIGGYGSTNYGQAWFDDIEVVRVSEVPEGYIVQSLAPRESSSDGGSGAGMTLDSKQNISLTLLISFAFLLFAMYVGRKVYSQRNDPFAEEERLSPWILVALLAAAALIRCVFAMLSRGYPNDMTSFMSWGNRILESGPLNFYSDDVLTDYPPGYVLILAALTALRNLLGATGDTPLAWLIIKLGPIASDVICTGVLYALAHRETGDRTALFIAALYAFNPAGIINSGAWGQVDGVLTLFIMLSMMYAIKGKWKLSLPIYAFAVLLKPQALMFGPIGLFAVVVEIIRSKDKRATIKDMLISVGLSLALILAVVLPFAWNRTSGYGLPSFLEPIGYMVKMYSGTYESYAMMSVNACNLYELMGLNWVNVDTIWWSGIASAVTYIVTFGYVFFLYWKSRDRKSLFICCAITVAMIFCFGIMMHERYMFPAILFTLIAFAYKRDWRLLAAAALLSVGQYINTSLVLHSLHLVNGEAAVNHLASVMHILGTALLCWSGFDICVRGKVYKIKIGREGPDAEVTAPALSRNASRRENARLNLKRIDYILMLGLTAIYSVVAFTNLGSTAAPETSWTSTSSGESVVFDLGETRTFNMTYYGGICNTAFTVEFSDNGEEWSEPGLAEYRQGTIFRWLRYTPSERNDAGDFYALESGYPMDTARYVRLTAESVGLILHEVGFLAEDGSAYPIASVKTEGAAGGRTQSPEALIDEQDTVPPYPSYYNGTYFDEIYHARTAYEHMESLRPYEYTHPPLGKVIMMLGIELFGMNPFGWRFMGALVGVLMLPIMYLMVKQLIGRTDMAFVAMFLLAVDCMHFTQTRIATIDSYGVFFIMLMYLFMFRYLKMSMHYDKLWRTLVPLGLCGISMGLGIASKWIGVYAALGLAVLLFYSLWRRFVEYRWARERNFETDAPYADKYARNLIITLAFCIVAFIVIPVIIYYFSYYWHLRPSGGLNPDAVWSVQERMFNYHSGLSGDTHSYRSPWYEWPLIIKPMWYFSGNDFLSEGMISSISCLGNPIVWWGGLAALIFVLIRKVVAGKGGNTYLYVLIAFAAQFLPWTLITRSTFIYHYFASVPFIIICTVLVFDYLRKKGVSWYRVPVAVYMAIALGLFILFYPVMSGTPMTQGYAMYLDWFNGWYIFRPY